MKKFSLVCAALMLAGCATNQSNQSVTERYLGATSINLVAPKGMEEVTPQMVGIYELAKQLENADSANYYLAQYINLDDVLSTGRSCAVFTTKPLISLKVPYSLYQYTQNAFKNELSDVLESDSVQKKLAKQHNKINELFVSESEYTGLKIIQNSILHEDANSLVNAIVYEEHIKDNGQIHKVPQVSVAATNYLKDKILSLKCQGRIEDKEILSSLMLEWNKAFFDVNK